MFGWLKYSAAALAMVGVGTGAVYVSGAFAPKQCSSTAIAGGKATIGGDFTLVNHLGDTVTDKDIITGPTLIYFGYTYCPDVCPIDAARNAEAIDILDAEGISVQPVFISIDPERDTVSALADFVEVIHPRMIGLTGSLDQVKTASLAFKTYFSKNGKGDDYLMDHTTFTYLMGTDGLWEYYRRELTAEQVADSVACFVGEKV